jgi:hypothetical protein
VARTVLAALVRGRGAIDPYFTIWCGKPRQESRSWATTWPAFLSDRPVRSGLLWFHLLVVVMMVVVVLAVMMVTVMLVVHRCGISAGRAKDRHRDSQGNSQPEGREEGLLHDIVSFFERAAFSRSPDQISGSGAAIGTIVLDSFGNFSRL